MGMSPVNTYFNILAQNLSGKDEEFSVKYPSE
jgi:hypothetical protein